jgi:hypothetical protein
MAEEAPTSPADIKRVAEEALRIQRHLLRRAWGVLYATYSVSIFVAVFSSALAYAIGLADEYTLAAHVAVAMMASGAALTVTLHAFGRVRDTVEVRSLVFDAGWASVLRYRVLVPVWIAIYAVVIVSMVLLNDHVGLLVLVIYAGFWGLLYYALGLSFPEGPPFEGVAALSSFGVAIAGSVILLLSVGVSAEVVRIYGLLWGATVIIWAASALYARTRKPSEAPEGEAH